jgi:hypothetical protein
MADDFEEPEGEAPPGAAVFPLIPLELGIHPLLLAAIHAIVFLDGSADEVVNPAAAGEALEYIATYLQRLTGADLRRTREDMATLVGYARQKGWPKKVQQFFKAFLEDFGVGSESKA